MIRLRMKELAEQKGLNQKDIAEKAPASAGTINRYWHGYGRQIDVVILERVAKVLEVPFCDLFEVTEEKEKAQNG